MQIRVWAILGDTEAGKSTMIGHLTSMFGPGENGIDPKRQKPVRTVLLRGGGYLRLWTMRQALQEANKSPERFVNETLKRSAKMALVAPRIPSQYFNILIALRYDATATCPAGSEYLSFFCQQPDFALHSLVCLPSREAGKEKPPSPDLSLFLRFGVPTCLVRSPVCPDGEPISHQVGQIRNHFGWA